MTHPWHIQKHNQKHQTVMLLGGNVKKKTCGRYRSPSDSLFCFNYFLFLTVSLPLALCKFLQCLQLHGLKIASLPSQPLCLKLSLEFKFKRPFIGMPRLWRHGWNRPESRAACWWVLVADVLPCGYQQLCTSFHRIRANFILLMCSLWLFILQ